MPYFGKRSRENLLEAHTDLQRLFNEVIKHFDCSVIEGYRDKDEQNKAFNEGKSTLKYPESKHNHRPSLAVDVVPYPIDWNDVNRFHYFAGVVKGIATQFGINIIWGGDWDNDTLLNDQTFNDLPHFQLK